MKYHYDGDLFRTLDGHIELFDERSSAWYPGIPRAFEAYVARRLTGGSVDPVAWHDFDFFMFLYADQPIVLARIIKALV